MLTESMLQVAREMLVTLADDATLIEAAKLLRSGTDIVVVCDSNGILRGVVTKTDVVRQISVCQGASCTCPVAAVMSRDVSLCRKSDRLEDVAELMKQRHLKNMPMIDADNRPVGVLTARAVLRALWGDAKYEEAQLINYVDGIGYR